MITAIGEVLIDEFPRYNRIGGAPLNFAANAFRLGEAVHLVSRIGKDEAGRRIAAEMRAVGLDASGIQKDLEKATGRVRVELEGDGSHHFDILTDAAFDHIRPPAPIPSTKLVYFGTLAQRTPAAFERIQRFVASQPQEALRMLDINLRPGAYTPEVVTRSLGLADILKLNEEEWDVVRDMTAGGVSRENFGSWLMQRFGIDLIALTRGAAGAELLTANGAHHRLGSPPVTELADTVGAGDGFAAVLAVGLLQKRPLQRILEAAIGFASSVCAVTGALPEDSRLYRAAAAMMEGTGNEE